MLLSQILMTKLVLEIWLLSPLILTRQNSFFFVSSETPPQAHCVQTLLVLFMGLLSDWLLTVMSSLQRRRALTNSLGDTLEERQLNWGASGTCAELKQREWRAGHETMNSTAGSTWSKTFLFYFFHGRQKLGQLHVEVCTFLIFLFFFSFSFLQKPTFVAILWNLKM